MLSLNRRYLVTLSYDEFIYLDKKIAYNVIIEEGFVTFYTTKKGLSYLYGIENIEVTDLYKKYTINLIKKHLIFTLLILAMFVIMITSSIFIRKIEFKKETIHNYEIKKLIEKDLKKFGSIYYLNISVNDLNKKLRFYFPNFEYIGVLKEGAKLVVDVVLQNLDKDDSSSKHEYGDVVSKYDGYITLIKSSKGIVNVTTSQSVKKGDLLISGNLNYKVDPNSVNNLVRAEGIVLAHIATYEKIIVYKKIIEKSYTGNVFNYYGLNLFNKTILNELDKKQNYGHILYENIFSINGFISFYKVKVFEEDNTIVTYNYDDAYNYAYSKIFKQFNIDKIHENEEIKFIDFINYIEYEDKYVFNFLVNQVKNIGEFKKYNL